jgi:signal transduction histidine kinase
MSIQGYAEAIKDGVVEGKEMEESLAIIIEESQRLKKVVEEIIYLTKLENVEDIFNFEEGNIGEVIRKAIKSVKPLLDEKNIQINLKGNFDYLGKFDSEKIKRAFINILGNCVRYAKSTIIIEVTRAGNNLEIFIKDDGPGFKDGEEKRIFDRFYKGNKGGTGLGLAITKAIIEGHQGMIEAFNNSSYGAGFKIHLPLEKI